MVFSVCVATKCLSINPASRMGVARTRGKSTGDVCYVEWLKKDKKCRMCVRIMSE